MTRQAFVAWLMCASGVALAGTHVLVATQENSQIPPAARNYWAFKLPVQSAVPETATRFDNPIDRFLEKTRRERGSSLRPARRGSALLRRAYLDLIGLPPTPAETAAFLADNSPDAWERLIDTLLASPHYGERWGRHWLDVARYADSSGFEQDYDRPNAWRYRDYVIRAFNQDKPYNVVPEGADRRRRARDQDRRDADRDRLPARRTARGVPREGQPGTPLRVPGRHDRARSAAACSGSRSSARAATTTSSIRFRRRITTACRPRSSATSRPTHPLVPAAEAEAYEKKMREIDARQAALKAQVKQIEAPYRTAPASGGLQEVSGRRPAGHRQAGSASGRRASSCSHSR